MLLMLHCARDTRLSQRIRCCRRPIGSQALGPPAVLPLVVPQILQIGEHFAAEQVDVLEAQFVRHRAEMQKRKEMADAQPLHPFEELIAHGLPAMRNPRSMKSLYLRSRTSKRSRSGAFMARSMLG